jgi:hypothetical protein
VALGESSLGVVAVADSFDRIAENIDPHCAGRGDVSEIVERTDE